MDVLQVPDRDVLLGQDFKFRPQWWSSKVDHPKWSDWLGDLPKAEDGYHRISRADLLDAATAGQPDVLGRHLVAGYVWGTGPLAFLVGRRARVFRDNSQQRITEALHGAHAVLKQAGPVEAYRLMLRGGPHHLKFLGPSFFTKFLYAADSHNGEAGSALILDRLVAMALNEVEGWTLTENGPWSPEQYGAWLEYAHHAAATRSGMTGQPVRPDAIEYAMFKHGRTIYDARRARRA